AYDFDGADEVCLENETGFLVQTGDTDTVAQRLLQLAKEPALCEKFGQTGMIFVRENFSIEKMVDDQYTVYQKLAAERGIRA
ncbi:MAG TPA: glycosyltransferase, partial [Verrucomicrobiae bacterium]